MNGRAVLMMSEPAAERLTRAHPQTQILRRRRSRVRSRVSYSGLYLHLVKRLSRARQGPGSLCTVIELRKGLAEDTAGLGETIIESIT